MSHRHNLCHIAMPRLCPDRYSYSKKRNVYQLDGVLLNFCTRRTGQSVVTPVPTGTRAACSTGDLNTNFDTEQVVPTPDDTAQQSIVYWYYCSISLTAQCWLWTMCRKCCAQWAQRWLLPQLFLLAGCRGPNAPAVRCFGQRETASRPVGCGELVALGGGGAATAGTQWPGGVGWRFRARRHSSA